MTIKIKTRNESEAVLGLILAGITMFILFHFQIIN